MFLSISHSTSTHFCRTWSTRLCQCCLFFVFHRLDPYSNFLWHWDQLPADTNIANVEIIPRGFGEQNCAIAVRHRLCVPAARGINSAERCVHPSLSLSTIFYRERARTTKDNWEFQWYRFFPLAVFNLHNIIQYTTHKTAMSDDYMDVMASMSKRHINNINITSVQ